MTLRTATRIAACVFAALLRAQRADADIQLAPAHDGYLGAWLAAGPFPKEHGSAIATSTAAPKLGAPARPGAPVYRLATHRDGALDLRQFFNVGREAGPRALLGAELSFAEDFVGHLLLSVDGGLTVVLDGETIWSRDVARTRGSSWDVVPLRTTKGTHRILLWLHHRGEHWALAVRLVDAASFSAPAGFRLGLPGATDTDARKLARELLSFEVSPGLFDGGYRPVATLAYRRGMPLLAPSTATIAARAGATPLFEVRLGQIPLTSRGALPLTAVLPTITTESLANTSAVTRATLTVTAGSTTVEQPLLLARDAPELARQARTAEAAVANSTGRFLDRDVLATTIAWQRRRLERAGAGKRASDRHVLRATRRVAELLRSIAAGQDPLAQAGIRSFAHLSTLDADLEGFRVHVPASFKPGEARRYPLVVALHGYNGRPSGVLQAFLDHEGRSAVSGVDGFVVAPAAHGNSFYRGAGETETLDVLDWMLRTYPIAPDRVSITGVSMGGTGAAHLALRYAERFSAAAPLCGYQSYFVRRDVAGKAQQPWEIALMHHWSPASWAENGRHLPLYVAHGTKDLPLENSRVLVRRFQQLGYSVKDDWPDTGHAVWERTYAGAGLWPWLSAARRPQAPRTVVLHTDALRYGSQDWVHVTELAERGKLGRVKAHAAASNRIELELLGISGVKFDRKDPLSANESVTVALGGTMMTFAPGEPLELHRTSDQWNKGPGQTRGKRAGVEGPIHDVFLGPVVFVYGTQDRATALANREIAEAFARQRDYASVRYPVIADSELTAQHEQGASLFLVGTSRDNSAISAIEAKLPIRVDDSGIRVSDQRFTSSEIGALYIHPNPRNPLRYVVVLTAPDVAGLYRALSLPKLLPDYVVYDHQVATASGQQILGAARVVTAGFFTNDWSVPSSASRPTGP